MTTNLLINDFIIDELEQIMNTEKDKHHAPKPTRKDDNKGGKK